MEETNADASCYPDYAENLSDCPTQSSKMMWAFVCNLLLQFIYTLECFMRAFVERRDYAPPNGSYSRIAFDSLR